MDVLKFQWNQMDRSFFLFVFFLDFSNPRTLLFVCFLFHKFTAVCSFYKICIYFRYLLKLLPSRDNMRQIFCEKKIHRLCLLSVFLLPSEQICRIRDRRRVLALSVVLMYVLLAPSPFPTAAPLLLMCKGACHEC